MNSSFPLLLVAAFFIAGCSPQKEKAGSLSLAPLPFAMEIPAAILPRLSTGPVAGPFGEEVRLAGAIAATTVYYAPAGQADKSIFMTAYWFPAEKFDALQSPDQPPLFGAEVLRQDGKVLSVAGPLDAIFAPDSPDGQSLSTLYGVIFLPETYRSEVQ